MPKTYILENLGCANCAAKMEKKINELPEVKWAAITFATKQLKVESSSSEDLLPKLQEICSSVEHEVKVILQGENRLAKQQKGLNEKQKKHLCKILAGAGLFVIGSLSGLKIVYVAAYLLLGGNILKTACSNIIRGQIFDENFLMTIATLAAFFIGEFSEAVGVMLFFCVGEFFEHVAVEKSRNQIMEAVDLRPEVVLLVEGDQTKTIPAKDAKAGDLILIRPGDRIPLDGAVEEGDSRIDTSPVTGEPVPVKVEPGDQVISGCVNLSGTLYVCVEKGLEESMVTRILHSVENASASKPRLERFITRFARVYTPIVVALALLTAILPSLITGDWNQWIYTAVTFLVISCPCALVLSVPLAYFSGIGVSSKKKILLKGGIAMEALQRVKAVAMDKTGTITKGTFKVQKCVALGRFSEEEVLAMAAGCEVQSTHPIAHSIIEEAMNRNIPLDLPRAVEEIAGKGICAKLGKKEVICGNRELLQLKQIEIPDLEQTSATEVFVAYDGKLAGYIVISDSLKDSSKEAIALLQSKGLKTIMLTGDAAESAAEIGKQAGVEEVYAKLLPEEKFTYMEKIRQKYGPVMYVGDGINDAPVLAGADVGAAMGSGADAAIEAADVVFMTSSLMAVPEALEIAKLTNRIAMQNIIFALGMKALVLILGLFGYANMWMAVFADSGVAMLCVMNSIRILKRK